MWPLFILPVAGVVAFIWMTALSGPGAGGNEPGNAASKLIPGLGGHAIVQPPAANEAATTSGPVSNDAAPNEPTLPVPTTDNSEREIDIHLAHLSHATKEGDRRGKQLAHESLKKCRPDKSVDERVTNAMLSERNSFVRVEFFKAYHVSRSRFDWAMRVQGAKSGKFTGIDALFDPGETDELKIYLIELIDAGVIARVIGTDKTEPDAVVVSLMRTLLDGEKPDWALECAVNGLRDGIAEGNGHADLAKRFELELKGLLERQTAALAVREDAFLVFAQAQDDLKTLLSLLETPRFRPYLATVIRCFGQRAPARGVVPPDKRSLPVMKKLAAMQAEIAALCGRVLQGDAGTEEKQLLIQRLSQHAFAKAAAIIDAGLQRRDGNLGNYLAAWGRLATKAEDLKRLAEAAVSAEAATSAGAIEGLRQCGLAEAEAELKRLVEQGGNAGVQSQALGALLQRDPANAAATIEQYLGPDRDPSVRAVAVANIPASNIERLKTVGEDDTALRVRQAAYTRLGELKDIKLKSYFHRRMTTENSPLLAQICKKYYGELKELEDKLKSEGR